MANCKKLLFIGDLEGCLGVSIQGTNQNNLLCKDVTYIAIANILKNDQDTHVAFLGDYFDQGPHMMESIKGIAELIKNHKYQVHVILGNRDLNKMRLKIEQYLTDNFSVDANNESIFKDWRDNDKDKDRLDLRNDTERIQKLLANTCGAGKALENLTEELGNGNKSEALELYTNIFNKSSQKEFIENCQTLFEHGKIIEIVNVGEKNVLLSHSGSFSPAVFTLDIGNIKEPDPEQNLNNYQLIEHYRKQLDIENYSYNEINIKIDEVIKKYNKLYNDVREEVYNFDNEKKLSKEYYLLQAMGLKGTIGEFASPIESCVITPGCNVGSIKPINEDFNNYLKNQNIHFISHGHIPFCCTVPLIYKNGDIIFISNDTSNGNRPFIYENRIEIPLSYVSSTNVGICSIGKDSINHKLDDIKAYTNGNDIKEFNDRPNKDADYYRGFVKDYDHDKVELEIGTLNRLFTDKFLPMQQYSTEDPKTDAPTENATEASTSEGGKRRRTRRKNKNKNAKKTNKKGKSKKYRKKGRKTRKIRRRK